MPPIRPIADRRPTAPFNPPTAAAPIMVDLRSILPALIQQQTPQPTQRYDDGYRRYLHCAECDKTAKIFVCWKGSEKSCASTTPTHTHVICDCGNRKFAGAVKFRTKQDEVVAEQVAE